MGRLAALASAADETPEGKSIVKLFEQQSKSPVQHARRKRRLVPFTAQTRMSGIDLPDGRRIRKGAPDAIIKLVDGKNGGVPDGFDALVKTASLRRARRRWWWPKNGQSSGVVVLEDILKPQHERALRAAAEDGTADRHDHGGQPADGGDHCRASGSG